MSHPRLGPGPFYYRHPLLTALIVVAALATVTGGVVGWRHLRDQDDCGSGLEARGEQCVGLTDGGHPFFDELRGVSQRIEAENDRVEQTGKEYVTIAFARPMGEGQSGAIRDSLAGAYAAQWRANRGVRGESPLIRLVIGNFGERSEHWKVTAEKIVEESKEDNGVVAVAGISRSTKANGEAMRYLSEHGIPMVSDVLTVDEVPGVRTLARVAPTNSDQATAAAGWLKDQKVRRVQLVFDRDENETYSTSLRTAFREAYSGDGHALVEERGSYAGRLPSLGDRFSALIDNLCYSNTRTIYFAGRSDALRVFVAQLGNRGCQDVGFTVVTGDDATLLRSDEQLDQALAGRIRLVYTGLTHPGVWDRAEVNRPAVRFFTETFTSKDWFPDATLTDGHAVMAHDAVLTAIAAIRYRTDQGPSSLSPEAVQQKLQVLNGVHRVPGASGDISLDNEGYAQNKAVPVLELRPHGGVELRDVSYPDGHPPR